jgi:hypothetical protein
MSQIMDHEWFKTVAQGLHVIEAQKAKRFASAKGEINKELHLHPSISSSNYWHRSDGLIGSDCFDWGVNFPHAYIKHFGALRAVDIENQGGRAYTSDTSTGSRIENTKTLIARILLLKLQYLLTT